MRKRITALLLMIVMIFMGILIGSRRSLERLRDETEKIFVDGVSGDGYSIQSDLDKILADSYNLYTVAKNYLSLTDPLMEELLSARQRLAESTDPSEKFNANESLLEAVTALYFKNKEAPGLTEAHAKLAAQFYTEIVSRNGTIKNDGYNEAARKYNGTLKNFPVSIIMTLIRVEPLELFAAA
ncbi:MAG: LemA family protein [Eubacteriales bacterium]|nr:LemA family protein [Eubacteriales bacterium]